MKQFPKGTFYAFSGLYFLLTLLVMFLSDEPFGIAAVVAYIACLSLTILLISVPYFASYLINYYRKLHQIEEAIVRIDGNREGEKSLNNLDRESEEHPPYSAVSVIENSIPPEEIDILKKQSVDFPFGKASQVPSADPADDATGNIAISEAKHNHKTTEEEDLDKGQLSLLDDMFPMFTDVPSQPEQEELPEMEEEEKTPAVITTIQAYALLDPDCDLYVRGKAPFPHPKGIKMEKLDVGKYELILEDVPESLPVSFWMNNKKRAQNTDTVIESGAVNECYPEFQEAF